VFAGYLRFAGAVLAEALPGPVRGALRALRLRAASGGAPLRASGRLGRFLAAADLPLAARTLRWQSFFAFDLERILAPDLARALDPGALREHHEAPLAAPGTTLARVLKQAFENYLPCDLLAKMDRMSMAHALEVRSPLLDTAVVEAAARLPDGYKLSLRGQKRVLRAAFRDLVPRAIRRRGKQGFGVPLAAWFRGPLRDRVEAMLLDPGAAHRALLDPARVAWYVGEHLAGRADHGQQLWLLLTLEAWLRALPSWREEAAAGRPTAAR
jgi:asparagine synthase (glutamine-hydrolysing)